MFDRLWGLQVIMVWTRCGKSRQNPWRWTSTSQNSPIFALWSTRKTCSQTPTSWLRPRFLSKASAQVGVFTQSRRVNCVNKRKHETFVVPAGYRSVPLKNGFSDNLELASLLIHIDVQQAGVSKRAPVWTFSFHCATPWPIGVCFRERRKNFTRPPTSWGRNSLSPASLSCTTRTPISSAPRCRAKPTT